VHPDKGREMFLYELGTHEEHRREGVARSLVNALGAVARAQGCYGMWVGTESDNEAALATYRSAGFDEPEASVTLAVTFEPEAGSEELLLMPASTRVRSNAAVVDTRRVPWRS